MKEIHSDTKSIRGLLSGAKFAIDYYQREYRWKSKQIKELINDLSEKFLECHEPKKDRGAVEHYSHYFLGSIIISDKNGQKFIIDGQQRLTSLTLLLIYIYRQTNEDQQKELLCPLIFSHKFGKLSFNLDVPERAQCMNYLFKEHTGHTLKETDQPSSIINILRRYQTIEEYFPDELKGDSLPFFCDWLIENVHIVEIAAYSDADAYTIFETMNDRGLSLTPTDMLKGYLLANITEVEQRNTANKVWRDQVATLQKLGKDEDVDAIKSWLRSQYANTIRERKRDASPKDFDLIGTEFHCWVRNQKQTLRLVDSNAFSAFIEKNFAFFSKWYQRIREAADNLTSGLETIHFNAQNNFTLQYPVLLAPLRPDDSEKAILCKLSIVAGYLDILIARRIWNCKSTSYSTMQYNMFQLVILKIRNKTPHELAEILTERLGTEEETFASNDRFQLHGGNRPYIHRLLARMTDFVETQSNCQSRYAEYIQRGKKNGYEIEHIWADHFEQHEDEFEHPADFSDYRNHIGGLLLLPKSFNASYGDKPYAEKLDHYYSHNLLAKSLHKMAYQHNPGFKRFIEETKLPFRPHAEFKKTDMDARQKLYRQIAEQVWNPETLLQKVST